MKISKTVFKELLRCDRYSALLELNREKEHAVVAFSSNPTIEELESLEHKRRIHDFVRELEKINFEEDESFDDDPMLPFFDQLEDIASEWVEARYSGNIVSRKLNDYQKRLDLNLEMDSLHAFLDVYQEDEDTERIFEVKATTDQKFFDATVTLERDSFDEEITLFSKEDGIYYPIIHEDHEVQVKIDEALTELWKPNAATYPYLYDIAFQAFIANHNKDSKKHKEYYLVILHKNYVYDGNVLTDDVITIINVTQITKMMETLIQRDIEIAIDRVDHQDASPILLGKYCSYGKRDACPFIPICFNNFPNEKHVLTYIDRHRGYHRRDKHDKLDVWDLVNQGKTNALDFPLDYLDESNYDKPIRIRKNRIQYETINRAQHLKDDTPFFRAEEIKSIIKSFKYPIYYLDFESFPAPIPRFKGEIPYTQSVFQFSVHVEKEEGVCDRDRDHRGFVAPSQNDHRLELVEKLVEAIPNDGGTVLVWFEPFEKGRLEELANLFPEYRERLLDIRSRIYDLMKLFKGDSKRLGDSMFNYYHHEQEGSFSIKKILPTLTSIRYSDLSVKNGGEAMSVYASYPKLNAMELEKKLEDLTEYCKLDTYAMYILKNSVNKNNIEEKETK